MNGPNRRNATAAIVSGWAPAGWAQPAGVARDSAVKAAFLLKFGAFVTWPGGADTAGSPYAVAVIGDGAIASDLEAMARGRPIDGRPVRIDRISEGDLPWKSQVLFIGFTSPVRVRDAIARSTGPQLVVTQSPAGIEAGAMLNFVVVEGSVKFEASREAAARRGLQMSSRLLSLSIAGRGTP